MENYQILNSGVLIENNPIDFKSIILDFARNNSNLIHLRDSGRVSSDVESYMRPDELNSYKHKLENADKIISEYTEKISRLKKLSDSEKKIEHKNKIDMIRKECERYELLKIHQKARLEQIKYMYDKWKQYCPSGFKSILYDMDSAIATAERDIEKPFYDKEYLEALTKMSASEYVENLIKQSIELKESYENDRIKIQKIIDTYEVNNPNNEIKKLFESFDKIGRC